MEEGKAEPAEGAVLTMPKRRPGERDGKMGAEVGREEGREGPSFVLSRVSFPKVGIATGTEDVVRLVMQQRAKSEEKCTKIHFPFNIYNHEHHANHIHTLTFSCTAHISSSIPNLPRKTE